MFSAVRPQVLPGFQGFWWFGVWSFKFLGDLVF